MSRNRIGPLLLVLAVLITASNCNNDEPELKPDEGSDAPEGYLFGADLSYVNQVLDYGGVYKDNNLVKDPYEILKDHGTNLVRLRLWHNPQWTKEVYSPPGTQLYNDLSDVERAITEVKKLGMTTLLDFHYADNWADPGKQPIPAAWLEIKDISVLADSVYNYTFATLDYLDKKGLMPEYVQLGNETNCGMLYTDAPTGFPTCRGCDGQWANLRTVLNSAIQAVRDVSANSTVSTKVMLHVADPKNVDYFFDNIKSTVTDFDIIGFSYYPIWHTTVAVTQLSNKIADFKAKYNRDIIILETAYPWTGANNDAYGNIFGSDSQLEGYPYTPEAQARLIKLINQEVIDGGGIGTVYWEPGWITSSLKDQWGTGSSWENNAFFDYDGNLNTAINYMTEKYN
jgi:arabinogalactan endo-1,4-beta-galactosidase